MPRPRSSRRPAALAAILFTSSACSTFPGAADAGRRFLVDGFVTLTSPVQVPAMAARDAWNSCTDDNEKSTFWLPAYFVGYTLYHTGLCALHTLDFAAAPIHLVVGNGPPRIYEPYALPMPRAADSNLGHEVGELALYDAAGIGGVVIAWWFGSTYVPHLFHWFTD